MTTVDVCARFDVPTDDRDCLERACDDLMAKLLEREIEGVGIRDTAVSLDLGRGLVDVEVQSTADSFEMAEKIAEMCLADAISKARIHLPMGSVTFSIKAKRVELVV